MHLCIQFLNSYLFYQNFDLTFQSKNAAISCEILCGTYCLGLTVCDQLAPTLGKHTGVRTWRSKNLTLWAANLLPPLITVYFLDAKRKKKDNLTTVVVCKMKLDFIIFACVSQSKSVMWVCVFSVQLTEPTCHTPHPSQKAD